MLKALLPPPQILPPQYRSLPQNMQMEQALLGALLQNPGVLDKIDGLIDADDFYDPVHRQIYAVAKHRIEAGEAADAVALKTYFEAAEPVNDELTIPQYLGRLVVNAALNTSVESYARDIRSLAMRRQIIDLAANMAEVAYDSPPDADGIKQVEAAERELLAIAERSEGAEGAIPFAVSLRSATDRILKAYKDKKKLIGLSTGLVDLDQATGGLIDGLLYVAAGRPGMGKTAFLVGVGWHAAKYRPNGGGLPVLMFSLEMPRDQIAERILSRETGIDGDRLRMGQITEREATVLQEHEIAIRRSQFSIDDRAAISIDQLCARARRHHRQHDTRLILVDYIQLLNAGGGRRSDNRVAELTQITGKLKALAKELRVPIIALSQLSRAVETRDNKRPMLSDLRESGSIEQDADLVLMLYREEYYLDRVDPPDEDADPKGFSAWQTKMQNAVGKGEAIIAKNRFGRTDTIPLAWDGPTTSYHNLARQEAPNGR